MINLFEKAGIVEKEQGHRVARRPKSTTTPTLSDQSSMALSKHSVRDRCNKKVLLANVPAASIHMYEGTPRHKSIQKGSLRGPAHMAVGHGEEMRAFA